jgi:hypothetical protein
VIFKKPVNPVLLKKLLRQQCQPELDGLNPNSPSPASPAPKNEQGSS